MTAFGGTQTSPPVRPAMERRARTRHAGIPQHLICHAVVRRCARAPRQPPAARISFGACLIRLQLTKRVFLAISPARLNSRADLRPRSARVWRNSCKMPERRQPCRDSGASDRPRSIAADAGAFPRVSRMALPGPRKLNTDADRVPLDSRARASWFDCRPIFAGTPARSDEAPNAPLT